MTKLVSTAEFRAWCRRLRWHWPTKRPVKIRRVAKVPKLGSKYGNVGVAGLDQTGSGYHTIQIRRDLGRGELADVLLHEYAHVRCEEMYGTGDLHDEPFYGMLASMRTVWRRG